MISHDLSSCHGPVDAAEVANFFAVHALRNRAVKILRISVTRWASSRHSQQLSIERRARLPLYGKRRTASCMYASDRFPTVRRRTGYCFAGAAAILWKHRIAFVSSWLGGSTTA